MRPSMVAETTTRKSFEDLHDAEAFFHAVSNEREADARGVARVLAQHLAHRPTLKLLDFGGGDGRFMSHLLKCLNRPPADIQIAVVDLDQEYLASYAAQVQSAAASKIRTYSALPKDERYDAVIANHVLYYVPCMAAWIQSALRSIGPHGLCCVTMGCSHTPMGQIWDKIFSTVGRASPYLNSHDLEKELEAAAVPFSVSSIHFRIQFEDTAANKAQFMRFLLGENAKVVVQHADESLASFIREGLFTADHTDLIYSIRKIAPA